MFNVLKKKKSEIKYINNKNDNHFSFFKEAK